MIVAVARVVERRCLRQVSDQHDVSDAPSASLAQVTCTSELIYYSNMLKCFLEVPGERSDDSLRKCQKKVGGEKSCFYKFKREEGRQTDRGCFFIFYFK